MKQFLVLYNAPAELMEEWAQTSPEEQKKGMEEWVKWGDVHKADLVEFGNPVGKNKRITTDGVSDVSNEVGGYSIIQAESAEEAAQILSDNPHLKEKGAYCEMMEIVEM